MRFEERLDPEVVGALDAIPAGLLNMIVEDPVAARAIFKQLAEQRAIMLPPTDTTIEQRTIPSPNGDVTVFVYQPAVEAPRPGFLYIHGGGYIVGRARNDANYRVLAEHAECTLVSVDYRLAPEHPFPAGPEDCYTALLWMVEQAAELGIDTERLVIGGHSAGAGMAAGVALMNRDRGGPTLQGQWLVYPMIDNRQDTPSGHTPAHPKLWSRDTFLRAWQMYLGDDHEGEVSPYASAARATDLSGLPPAYVCVGSMDRLRDESIDYARRLLEAHIITELQVFPGCFHASELLAPMATVSQRMRRAYMDALKRMLA